MRGTVSSPGPAITISALKLVGLFEIKSRTVLDEPSETEGFFWTSSSFCLRLNIIEVSDDGLQGRMPSERSISL